MKYIVSVLLFLMCTLLYAQPGDKGRSIAIPRTESPDVPAATPLPADSPFKLDNTTKKPSFNYPSIEIGGTNKNWSMNPSNDFVSRGQEYEKRAQLKPQGESNEAFRGNQFFGEYRIKSDYIQIMARDFGEQDGDRIKVLVNGRTVVDEIVLTNDFKGIQLTLQPGFNKIDFEALNQGTSGPNTAEFRVYNDKQELVSGNQWNLATGFHATVMVVKE